MQNARWLGVINFNRVLGRIRCNNNNNNHNHYHNNNNNHNDNHNNILLDIGLVLMFKMNGMEAIVFFIEQLIMVIAT